MMKRQTVKKQEQHNKDSNRLSGPHLSGIDGNVITAVTQGDLSISNTDDDDDSSGIDFGSGSIFSSMDNEER